MSKKLLESSGYSWSGIADLLGSRPEKTQQLLHEINNQYKAAKAKQEKLEDELEKVKTQRGYCVSCFYHVHHWLSKKAGKTLDHISFLQGNVVVKIKVLDHEKHRIDYEEIELTALEGAAV